MALGGEAFQSLGLWGEI